MTHRERLLVELLRNLHLASEAAGPSGVRSSTGDRVPLLPHEQGCRLHRETVKGCDCWLASVKELQRCLRQMYGAERRLFRAVYERFVNAETRPRDVLVKANRTFVVGYDGPFEVLGLVPRGNGVYRVRVETWRDGLEAKAISDGLAWLSNTFVGSPRLPSEWRVEEAAA